jgi:hypothetical protein
MKETKVNVKLSDLGEGMGVFHDLRYTNDRYGGNQNEMTLEIRNESGNIIDVELGTLRKNEVTKEWDMVWEHNECDAVKVKVRGAIEHSEFLQMLQLILNAEKMVDIIKP